MKDIIITTFIVSIITLGLLLLNNYSKGIEYEKNELKPVINTVPNNENSQNNFVPPVVTQQPTENNSYKVFQNITTASKYDTPSDFTMPDNNTQNYNPDVNNQENIETTTSDSILNHNKETIAEQKFSILPNPEENSVDDENDSNNNPNMDDFSLVVG